jgi:hypothetical protein
MLDLLIGIEAARRLTEEAVAVEPTRRRRRPARRSRTAAARQFVSAAIVALGNPTPRTGAPSRAARRATRRSAQRPAA